MLIATALASAGRFCNYDDFKCCKMDEKYHPLLDDLEPMKACDENE